MGTIGFALIGVGVRAVRWRSEKQRLVLPPSAGLIVALAPVTPIGLCLYGLQPEKSLLVARNLSASLPAFAVLVGWVLTSLPRPFATGATAVVLLGVTVGTVRTLEDDHQRPPYRQIAHFLDDALGPRDVVLADPTSYVLPTAPAQYLDVHFQREHTMLPPSDAAAWERAAHGGRVFLVQAQGPLPRLGGPEKRILLRGQKDFPGQLSFTIGRYQGEIGGSLVRQNGGSIIRWSQGPPARISSGAVLGFVDAVSLAEGRLEVRGWALDASEQRAADAVPAFVGGRLVGVGRVDTPRPDVAEGHGGAVIVSGYTLVAHPDRRTMAELSRLRVFGVVGDQATELVFPPAVRKTLRRTK